MLIKWSCQLGKRKNKTVQNFFADSCEVETLDARALEIIGRTIVESMLLYAGAESYVDRYGNLQLKDASSQVTVDGFKSSDHVGVNIVGTEDAWVYRPSGTSKEPGLPSVFCKRPHEHGWPPERLPESWDDRGIYCTKCLALAA